MFTVTAPASFRVNNPDSVLSAPLYHQRVFAMLSKERPPPHSSHPALGYLILLVFEAVLEVVFVSLPGYIVARQGLFDAEAQKFVANLNVMVFTPCLIFTKLASQLNEDRLVELAIIPIIFIAQTIVSYVCSIGISKLFRFKKRPANFVTAMGVFGNSNSLPISLVISLAHTISGLHWDQIPGDNDDEVAARGILYLLIFQQLGQLLRWSWGYNVLLKPKEAYEEEGAHSNDHLEGGRYHDDPEEEDGEEEGRDSQATLIRYQDSHGNVTEYQPGMETPITHENYAASSSGTDGSRTPQLKGKCDPARGSGTPADAANQESLTSFPPVSRRETEESYSGFKKVRTRLSRKVQTFAKKVYGAVSTKASSAFHSLPIPMQKALSVIYRLTARFLHGLWEFMNPPLWAMLVAIVVASIPDLQAELFTRGTFVNNSVTSAISQSGGVAVPLILVVLGANLARNTLPKENQGPAEDPKEERNLLIACLISRMLLPTLIMAPILAVTAKYVPVSILDDPIFIIVCFLLTGAPSALQLAQICQINNVYMGAMSKLLFQSYVVWILPSTLILVVLAIEVVEWAGY